MPIVTPQAQALWDLFASGAAVTVADAAKADMPVNTARGYFAEWKRIGAIGLSHTDGKTRYYKRLVEAEVAPREVFETGDSDDERGLRERAWSLFGSRPSVTLRDFEEAGIFRKSAESFLSGWQAAGAIVFDHREGKRKYFRRVVDTETPPLTRRADAKLAPRDRVALNLWRAARGLKVFTPRDLAVHAATSDTAVELDDAVRFARMLHRAEYVRVVRKARPSEDIEARYRLVRDTGPKPPVEKRVRAVWDSNTETYAHVPEGLT